MAFAGVGEGWRGPDGETLRSFATLTTAANASMEALHDRMLVILGEEHWPVWLGERAGEATSLMRPADDGLLHLWAVSRAVNSVRNNSPDLLDRSTIRMRRHRAMRPQAINSVMRLASVVM